MGLSNARVSEHIGNIIIESRGIGRISWQEQMTGSVGYRDRPTPKHQQINPKALSLISLDIFISNISF